VCVLCVFVKGFDLTRLLAVPPVRQQARAH
jgi:hypothetical protein